MKKINSVIYNKLYLQAQEAKLQKLNKLASGIINALGPMPEDENINYNYQQLHDEVYHEMWKLATHVIKYYDVKSADASKIHDTIEVLAEKFLDDLQNSLNVDDVISGPLESPLPGENK